MTAHSRVFLRKHLGFETKYRCNFRDCTDLRVMSLMTATEHQAKHFEVVFRTRAHYNFQCHVCNVCFYNKSHHRMCSQPQIHKQYFQTINQVPMTDHDFHLSVEFSRFVNIHLQPVNEEGIPLLPAKREASNISPYLAPHFSKTSFEFRSTSGSTSPGFRISRSKTSYARSPGTVDQETLDKIQRNKDEFRTVSRGTTRVPPATNRGVSLLEELPPPSTSRLTRSTNAGGRTPQHDGARSFTAPSTYSCGTPRTPREEDDALEEPVPAYMRGRSPLPSTSSELGRNLMSYDNLKPAIRKRAPDRDLFDQNSGAKTPPPVNYCTKTKLTTERYWFDAPVEADNSNGETNIINCTKQSENQRNASGSKIALPSAITRSRPGGTKLLDHIPSQPKSYEKSRVSCSPGPRVSRSPGPRVSRSPGPRVSRSPGPRVSRSPGPRVSRSPGPRVSRSPGPRVSRSPGPRVLRSPGPRVSRSPGPRVSRSPAPRVSRSPDSRSSSSPGPRIAYSPGPWIARSPIAHSRTSSLNEGPSGRESKEKAERDTENSSGRFMFRDSRYYSCPQSKSQGNSNSLKERNDRLKKIIPKQTEQEQRACQSQHDTCDRRQNRGINKSTGHTRYSDRGRGKVYTCQKEISEREEMCRRRPSPSTGFQEFTRAKKHRSRSRSYDKSRPLSSPTPYEAGVKNETDMSSSIKRFRRERSYSASNSD